MLRKKEAANIWEYKGTKVMMSVLPILCVREKLEKPILCDFDTIFFNNQQQNVTSKDD